MKPANFLRYILLPLLALTTGIRLGVKYATDNYVVKDKKFIKGEIINKKRGGKDVDG